MKFAPTSETTREVDRVRSSADRATPDRIVQLEVCRGIAAMVVFHFHFLNAFAPSILASIVGTPLHLLVNGHAAVVFFFVLSGYVLTLRYYQTGDSQLLVKSSVKRLPRLAALTVLMTLSSCALFWLGAYRFEDAAVLNGSEWLRSFSGIGCSQNLRPSFLAAFWQGSVKTFFRGDANLDVVLWTMRFEFFGSLLVYAIAMPLRSTRRVWQATAAAGLAATAFILERQIFLAFIAGTLLALFHTRQLPRVSTLQATVLLGLSLLLMGFEYPIRWYAVLDLGRYNVRSTWLTAIVDTGLLSVGSLLLIHVVMGGGEIFARLRRLRPIGQVLGLISFPLYLCHPLVIFSFSSWLLLRLHGLWPNGVTTSIIFLATVSTVVALSWLLAKLDRFWTRLVNGQVDRMWS